MAIKPIFEFPIDAEGVPPTLVDHFVDGEKVLSVASPVAAAPNGAFYLSRRMRFAGGTYQVKAYVDDAATWWIGSSLTNQRLAWTSVIGQVLTGEFYIPEGIQRLDIILQNLPATPTPCYAVFSLWKGTELIYASNGEHWLFDQVPIPDEDLPQIEDIRLSMPVWAVLPNWKGGMSERLSWKTDVMESETGAEQRRSVLAHPRRTVEVDFLREGAARSRMDLFFNGIGKQEILVPMWHEAVKMVEGIRIGATGVAFSEATTATRRTSTCWKSPRSSRAASAGRCDRSATGRWARASTRCGAPGSWTRHNWATRVTAWAPPECASS